MTIDELYQRGQNAPRNTREATALDRARRTITGLQYTIGLPPENDFVISDIDRCRDIINFLSPYDNDLFNADGEIPYEKMLKLSEAGHAFKEENDVKTMDEAMAMLGGRDRVGDDEMER